MRLKIPQGQKPKKLRCKSPCIGVCTSTNLGDDYCRGCFRDFQHVLDWNFMSEHEKVVCLIKSYENYKKHKAEKEQKIEYAKKA